MRMRMITSLFYVNWFHDFLRVLSYCREQKKHWTLSLRKPRCCHTSDLQVGASHPQLEMRTSLISWDPPPTGANSAPTGSWNILKIIWSCLILHPILASHWQSVWICCMSQALNCLRPSCNALISGQTWWYLAGVKRMWPFVGPWR